MNSNSNPTIDDVALDVELEEVQFSYSFGEARPGRGAASLAGTTSQQRISSATIDFEAMTAIRDVIEAYETLPPSGVKASFGVLTTAPYTSVSGGLAELIDGPALDQWLQSAAFAAAVAANGGNQKQNLQLIKFDVMLIDENSASVHYSIRETSSAGTVNFAASAAILIKDIDAWRIAVHMQHPI